MNPAAILAGALFVPLLAANAAQTVFEPKAGEPGLTDAQIRRDRGYFALANAAIAGLSLAGSRATKNPTTRGILGGAAAASLLIASTIGADFLLEPAPAAGPPPAGALPGQRTWTSNIFPGS